MPSGYFTDSCRTNKIVKRHEISLNFQVFEKSLLSYELFFSDHVFGHPINDPFTLTTFYQTKEFSFDYQINLLFCHAARCRDIFVYIPHRSSSINLFY